MRHILCGALILATVFCGESLDLPFEWYDGDDLKDGHHSRRAIDGSRGRKHFDPKEDGFFNDYGFEKSQYYGNKEQSDFTDIRNNVPGEPGTDYPAYLRVPRTSFSCHGRSRGYYADEEVGCQAFHVCDEGLVSSFLCPVGSLFSQRLLTCDWWSKVRCHESEQYFHRQAHDNDVSLTNNDMIHQALNEMTNYRKLDVKKVTIYTEVKNQNQLDQGNDYKPREHHRNRFFEERSQDEIGSTTDKPIVRIEPAVGDDRISRTYGNTRGVGRRRPSQYETTSVTSTTPLITSTPVYEDNNYQEITTISLYHTTEPQLQGEAEEIPTEIPQKEELEESGVTNVPELNHNSADEYDDMLGKESIGLVNSQSERNLESAEDKPSKELQDLTTQPTTTEYTEATTISDVTEFTTAIEETMEPKESLGLIHSMVEEKLQLYDEKKEIVIDISRDSTETTTQSIEATTEAVTSSYEDGVTTEASTEMTTSYEFPDKETSVETEKPKSKIVVKFSGFRINVPEKEAIEATTLPYDEISSSDYQELLNSSDTSFTSNLTPSTVTESNFEDQTTIVPNRRISDTVEESNAPFEVTLTLNSSDVQEGKSPIGAELISQIISQQEDKPIVLEDVQIVASKQTMNHQIPTAAPDLSQNFKSINPTQDVRNHQYFRSYQEFPDQQHLRSYRPQQSIVPSTHSDSAKSQNFVPTTPLTPPIYRIYQNQQGETTNSRVQSQNTRRYMPVTTRTRQQNRNQQNQLKENVSLKDDQIRPQLQNFRNQQFVSTSTQTPIQHFRQRPGNFRYQQNQHDESSNFRNPKTDNFVPATLQNFRVNEEKLSVNDYQNHPGDAQIYQIQLTTPNPLNNLPVQQNEPNFLNHQRKALTDFERYHVNYQTHRYPENYPDYQEQQQQPQQYQNQNNYQNQNSPTDLRNRPQEQQQNINYPDYQTYDSNEEIPDNPTFENFGVRVSTKNQNFDSRKIVKMPKITEDPYTINSVLQDKNANFLYAMSQVTASTVRTPRPFTQEKNNNLEVKNNFVNVNNKPVQNFNQNVPHINNSYIQESYKATEVDAFAAPKHENSQEFNYEQNISKPRAERILTQKPKSSESNNPIQVMTNPSKQYTTFDNQGFVPILQPNFNNYDSDVQISLNNQPQNAEYDYQQNSQVIPDNSGIQNGQFSQNSQPQYVDYDSQNTQIPQNPQPQQINYNNYQSNIQQTRIPNNNVPHFQNTQSQSVDYNDFQQNTENSQVPVQFFQNTQIESFQQATQRPVTTTSVQKSRLKTQHNMQHQPIDYSVRQQNTQRPVSTRVTIPPNSQHQQYDYSDYQQNAQSQSVQPQSIDYSDYQQSTLDNSVTPPVNVRILPTMLNYQLLTPSPLRTPDVQIVENSQPRNPRPILEQSTQHSVNPNKIVPFSSTTIQNFKPTIASSSNSTTEKSNVETEFIPSLSFDFDSVQEKKEYFEAVNKGLVSENDNSKDSNEAETMIRSNKSSEEEVMDNFKDVSEVMSGTE